MAKRILIISPTPTHPSNAGNRIRILNMASFLIQSGAEVHFLYSRQENADEEAMRSFWGERFHAVDYHKPVPSKCSRYKLRLLKTINPHYQYYCQVDDHYNTLLDGKILELSSRMTFDVVLVEYIFLSRAFLNFGASVLKVIDTHDVMTDRHKLFLKEGKKPVWYSTPYRQERKGIRRADVVIAIQEKEKAHFRGMTSKKVINVGHIVKTGQPVSDHPRKKLLFVGSDNPSNHYGILDFLERDFPVIRAVFPDLELLIAGNLCRRLEVKTEGVRLLGEVADLSEAYSQADLVLNPLTIGTGLKIKMIEAMGLSKVVFSTPVGADGLEDSAGLGYWLYRSADELVQGLSEVFSDVKKYREFCKKAAEVAANWNRKNGQGLKEAFRMEEAVAPPVESGNYKGTPASYSARRLKQVINQDPGTKKFVIVSIPRSGSNLLVGMLGGHREITCYPELFHPHAIYDGGTFKKAGLPPYSLEERNQDPLAFLEYIYNIRLGKLIRTIGFKIFPGHHDVLLDDMLKEPDIRKILLIRENYLMNYISHRAAEQSQVYYLKAGTDAGHQEIQVNVDINDFLAYEAKYKAFFAEIREKLDGLGQQYHQIHYEDLLKPDNQADLLRFLGVNTDVSLLKVRSEKQSKTPLEQKVTGFEDLKEQLLMAGKGDYLKKEDI